MAFDTTWQETGAHLEQAQQMGSKLLTCLNGKINPRNSFFLHQASKHPFFESASIQNSKLARPPKARGGNGKCKLERECEKKRDMAVNVFKGSANEALLTI